MQKETLAIFMPVYNESAIVGEVLAQWESMLTSHDISYRIFAYNDSSKDCNLAILTEYAAQPGTRVTVIDKPNFGHGPTVLRGYRECGETFDWIFQMDSDDEIAPETFIRLWESQHDNDLVIGRQPGRPQEFLLMRSVSLRSLVQDIPANSDTPQGMLHSLALDHHLRICEVALPASTCDGGSGLFALGRFSPRFFTSILSSFKTNKLLKFGILCFLLALFCLLIPERYETVEVKPITENGVTAYELYNKQPLESIQRIRLEMIWSMKRSNVSPDDVFFAMHNSGIWVDKRQFDQLKLPDSPTRSYLFEYDLFDDFAELRAAPIEAINDGMLPLVMHKIIRGDFVKSNLSQYLLANDKLVKIHHLRAQIVVDLLLPKIISAVLAALGSVLLIVYFLKCYGKAPKAEFQRKLSMMVKILIAGMVIALATCGYYRLQGATFPYDTFLFPAFDRFNDLFNTFMVVRFLDNPYLYPIPGSGYFPFTYLLLKLIPSFNLWYVIFFSFTLFLSFYLVSAFAFCCRRNWAAIGGLLVILLLNYPLWYMLDRGNTDFLVYIILFLFLYFYRQKHDCLAILLLICAVNLKLYPAILAVFYLKDRAYGKFFVAALGSLVVFVLSLGFFDWNLSGLLNNLHDYTICYAAAMDGVISGHSLFGLFKMIANQLFGTQTFVAYANYYTVLALVIAGLVSYYVIWVEKVFWKNLYLLLAMMLLLPHVSFDYRMIVLVIPVLYYLVDDDCDPYWRIHCLFFGLLLIPIHWVFVFHGHNQLSVYVRPLLLLGLVGFIMVTGWRQRRKIADK